MALILFFSHAVIITQMTFRKGVGMDTELTEEELEITRQRFVQNIDTVVISRVPQCVGCIHNMGMELCDALSMKPETYITNTEPCPMREEGGVE